MMRPEVTPTALALDLLLDGVPDGMTLREAMDVLERLVVEATMARHGGRVRDAAQALGVTREGLYRMRQRLGMPVRSGKDRAVPADWRERLAR